MIVVVAWLGHQELEIITLLKGSNIRQEYNTRKKEVVAGFYRLLYIIYDYRHNIIQDYNSSSSFNILEFIFNS
jgi:hypothetical protein